MSLKQSLKRLHRESEWFRRSMIMGIILVGLIILALAERIDGCLTIRFARYECVPFLEHPALYIGIAGLLLVPFIKTGAKPALRKRK
jgi:hypothetical protein